LMQISNHNYACSHELQFLKVLEEKFIFFPS
jgi:hypothetical protein